MLVKFGLAVSSKALKISSLIFSTAHLSPFHVTLFAFHIIHCYLIKQSSKLAIFPAPRLSQNTVMNRFRYRCIQLKPFSIFDISKTRNKPVTH